VGKVKDLAGQKFGSLTVLQQATNGKWNEARWVCLCDCGKTVIKTTAELTRKRYPATSCGCQRKTRLEDLTGRRFGYLTVLERAENNNQGKTQWKCRCFCGNEIIVPAGDLKKPNREYMSCGCMKWITIAKKRRTHGMSHHPAWGVWHSMKQRCLDVNHPAFHNYGGRGISVCDRWLENFENFWQDMGSTWKKGLELDRVDNNRGYEPGNCRWVERKTNNRNRRTNRVVDSPLGRMTVAELSEKTGIGVTTLLYRLDHGWPTESLCVPPDTRNVSTTSGIVVRGTDSQFGTEEEPA
jgi:hypothetical protein